MASDHDYRLSGRTAHHKTVKHTSLNLTVPVFVACVAFRIHFCSVRKRKWILIRKGLVNRCVTQQFQCFFWYLPPANEVWGKVIFSQVFFHPRGGLCMMSLPVWLSVPMFLLGGSLTRVPCSFWGVSVQGVSVQEGVSVHRVSVQGVFVHGGLCAGRGWRPSPTPPNQKSGRYASYYLLQMVSNCDTVNFIQEFFSWNFRHNNNSRLILPSVALIIVNLLQLKHVWNRSSVQIIAW